MSSPTMSPSNSAAETTPPKRFTRSGTPLSPLSEELFGDILDAEPNQFHHPDLIHWSNSDGEDTDGMQKPRLTSTDSAAAPILLSEDLFEDDSQRTSNPSASPPHSESTQVTDGVSNPTSFTAILSNAPRSLVATMTAPPIFPHPVFCHSLNTSVGQATGAEFGSGARTMIRRFKNHLSSDWMPACSESVFEALSKALHFFEVQVEFTFEEIASSVNNKSKGEQKLNRRDIELSRFFIPSALQGDKYIEIHPKDVCSELNPARGRLGQMENIVPQVMFTCGCMSPSDHLHTLPRTVTLLKNHLYQAPVVRRPPRTVSGEWLVSGHNKEWGLPLDQARIIWKAAL